MGLGIGLRGLELCRCCGGSGEAKSEWKERGREMTGGLAVVRPFAFGFATDDPSMTNGRTDE